MKVEHTERGFEIISLPIAEYGYQRVGIGSGHSEPTRLVQQSSSVAYDAKENQNPGSSFLWIGEHQLDRGAVRELIEHLNSWLNTGSLILQK